jgi:hypothetical protein
LGATPARVIEQPGEVQRAHVVERMPGGAAQDRVDRGGQTRRLRDHPPFRRLQGALQPPQHRERQDYLAVLVGLEVATEQVGDAPDEGNLVGEPVRLPTHRITPDASRAIYCCTSKRGADGGTASALAPCVRLSIPSSANAPRSEARAIRAVFSPIRKTTAMNSSDNLAKTM